MPDLGSLSATERCEGGKDHNRMRMQQGADELRSDKCLQQLSSVTGWLPPALLLLRGARAAFEEGKHKPAARDALVCMCWFAAAR